MPPEPRSRISVEQVDQLLAAMGLPRHTPDATDGLNATALGGHTGTRPVKAAERIVLDYRYAHGHQLDGADLEDPSCADIRGHYEWAVARAPHYGFTITWEAGTARLILTRADTTAATDRPAPAATTHSPTPDRRHVLDAIARAARTVPVHLDPHTPAARRGEGATLTRESAAAIARVVLDALDASDHRPNAH
ncbi:hypothetical protein ACW14Y_42010 (plasmid) [Kitasatospora sp. cg17-2]